MSADDSAPTVRTHPDADALAHSVNTAAVRVLMRATERIAAEPSSKNSAERKSLVSPITRSTRYR